MNTLGTLNSLSSGIGGRSCINQQKDCSGQSIVKAMDNFVSAMNQMRNVVMVPSMLKDVTVTVTETAPLNSTTGALVPVSKQSVDLFDCYRMLHAVNEELVNGAIPAARSRDQNNNEPEDHEEKEVTDDQSERISSAFRQHLQGLFNILHQLTDTANFLSKKYQDNVEGQK